MISMIWWPYDVAMMTSMISPKRSKIISLKSFSYRVWWSLWYDAIDDCWNHSGWDACLFFLSCLCNLLYRWPADMSLGGTRLSCCASPRTDCMPVLLWAVGPGWRALCCRTKWALDPMMLPCHFSQLNLKEDWRGGVRVPPPSVIRQFLFFAA